MTRRREISLSAVIIAALVTIPGGPFLPPALAQESSRPEPAKLLEQADLSRNGWETYEVVTVIRNYQDGELKDEGSFDTYIKGADKTLVKFMNVDVKGQYLLMLEDAVVEIPRRVCSS